MTKYVYLFKEGNASMREPAWRQGREPCRDDQASVCRCPRASPSPPRPAPATMRTARPSATTSWSRFTTLWPRLEAICGKKFGDLENPLLVSVRSGARASMPGMMDTILNLGLNDEVVEGSGAT